MGGVDQHDQLTSYYLQDHRSSKVYQRLIIHILEMIIVNSHILYSETLKNNNKIPLNLLNYKKHIIKNLFDPTRAKKNILPSKSRGKL